MHFCTISWPHFLAENKKMTAKSVFHETTCLKMTSQSFQVAWFQFRGFVPHRKWNFAFLVYQNMRMKNRYRIFFALLISTLWRFYRANNMCNYKITSILIGWEKCSSMQFWIMICWMISGKMITKSLCGNFEKKLSWIGKNGFKKALPALPHAIFFMFVFLMSNSTVFLVQFGINLLQIELETVWLPILLKKNQTSFIYT